MRLRPHSPKSITANKKSQDRNDPLYAPSAANNLQASLLFGWLKKLNFAKKNNQFKYQNIDGLIQTEKSFFWNNRPETHKPSASIKWALKTLPKPVWSSLIKHMVKADQASLAHLLKTAEILLIAALLIFFL